jgi:1-deoxyxylulose-5-phosphate synthase
MEYRKLGSSGLEVSPVCVGCMTFGDPDRGSHGWTLPEDQSRPLIRHAVEAGINFFDTANVYSDGHSEEIVGRTLAEYARRDEVVIATKVYFSTGPGPNRHGLSRKAIFTEVDASLRRLGTDYIDLYQIHAADPMTPWEETLDALNDVVRADKVRYIGASSLWAWEFCKALYLQRLNGWARFVSIQDHYNLLDREEEREVYPLCADQGIGVMPWSPLARGKLTRDWDTATTRSENDAMQQSGIYGSETDRAIVEKVAEIAASRGVSRAQIALAWIMRNPVVTAPIVGASKISHLDDAIAATTTQLSDDEIVALEQPYRPRPAALSMMS